MGGMIQPLVMGILNVTPDSFSDGGQFFSFRAACDRAAKMAEDGADIIDVGGESTRPGAKPVSSAEEIDRVVPVIERIKALGVRVSSDTSKPDVAKAAIAAGASIINDVTGGRNENLLSVVAGSKVDVILMHMQGEPQNMQTNPHYPLGVVTEVKNTLVDRVKAWGEAGVDRGRIWIDPGIGFGKTLDHNLELLRNLSSFQDIGHRLVIGTSRKSFLSILLGSPDVPFELREAGSVASNLWAWAQGATVFRVHEVGAMKRALITWRAIAEGN
jgi:dihydropteroate synthase